MRNDRVVAIEVDNYSFADVKHIDDLGKPFQRELEDFFVNYHRLSGRFRVLGIKGSGPALKAIAKAQRRSS